MFKNLIIASCATVSFGALATPPSEPPTPVFAPAVSSTQAPETDIDAAPRARALQFAASAQSGNARYTVSVDKGTAARSMYPEDPSLHAVDDRQGQLLYPYGQAITPIVTCAPLHLCVINLMKGEEINDTSLGDTVRWIIRATRAGDRPVVVLKPVEAGLSTSLVITTNMGRVYYINLVSKKTNYIPQIGFYDPQAMSEQYAKAAADTHAAALISKEKKEAAIGMDPADLDFNYSCTWDGKGSNELLPVRVFSGDGHLYIKMLANLSEGDAPAVFNTSNGTNELVNFRLVRGYYIIDGVPDKIKLTIGTDKSMREVVCEHGGPTPHGWFGLGR